MSFMGGAECSTAGNPLSQFAKHVQDDRSLQRDRLVNGGPSSAMGGFRSAGRGVAQDEMVNSFLQQGPSMPEMAMEPGPGPMSPMGALQLDPAAARVAHMRGQSASPVWSGDNFRAATPMDAGGFHADEFAKFQQQQQNANQAQQQHMASASPAAVATVGPAQHMRPMMGMGGLDMQYGSGMPMGMYASRMSMLGGAHQQAFHGPMMSAPAPAQQQQEGKGKGKVVELNDHEWEEQFARMELHDRQAAEAAAAATAAMAEQTAQDDDQAANDAIERELNKVDEQVLGGSETNFGDLEAVWKGIQAENEAMREAFDGGDWKDVTGEADDWEPLSYRMGLDPRVEPYDFDADNMFRDHADPFGEGVRIMNENGNLSLAALAFEMACERGQNGVEAWVWLGTAQAQNEKETSAIRAFEQALKMDPTNLEALMALAVSYTNEGYDTTAYRTLERWLSAKYPQVLPPTDLSSAADVGFTDRQQLHDRITQRFIEAAQLSPDGEHMDPDVQVGLGVLFYGGEEFDKAVDCFHAALASSEQGASNKSSQVHLLWNRLGATLANSGRSEEAIAAYEQALALHPNFVRARYNLGVSCINMGCYDEAASHLLAALSMHKEAEKAALQSTRESMQRMNPANTVSDDDINRIITQNRSTTLYDTLRRVFGLMDRRDLADRVSVEMDPDIFRGEFDF